MMLALAERKVPPRVYPFQVELVGIRKDRCVAVGGGEAHVDRGAPWNCHTSDLGVLAGGTVKPLGRRFEAQHFFGEDRDPLWIGAARSSGGIADVAQLRLFARLPGTAVELEIMQESLGAPPGSVHILAEATEGAIKSADLSRVGILALATHGVMAGELRGAVEPGLVFTPPRRDE